MKIQIWEGVRKAKQLKYTLGSYNLNCFDFYFLYHMDLNTLSPMFEILLI